MVKDRDEGKDQDMGQVAGQVERDMAMYHAWVDGETQASIGERHGVTQQAVSAAIGRALDQLPDQDKAAEIRRTLDLVDELVLVYAPKAKAGDAASSREVRGLLALRGRFLGVDRREIHVEGTIEHDHQVTHQDPIPGVPVSELLERWAGEGRVRIRGELVRTDGGPDG